MDDEHNIAIQVSYGSYSYTTQVTGTPWSPDVFNDISTQALRGLKGMIEEHSGDHEFTVVTGDNADDVLERLLKLTDENGD